MNAVIPIQPNHVRGAANLKQDLKEAFPGVEFRVTSQEYSGGNSIDVWWTGGPLKDEVETFSKPYTEGKFDGMDDLYVYDHSPEGIAFRAERGGAMYVGLDRWTQRTDAEERNEIMEALKYFHGRTDRAIAKMCHVHHKLVAEVRKGAPLLSNDK